MGYGKLTDESLMPFGKHKGKMMIDVPASWFLYMYDEMNISKGNVRDYIEENLEVLRKEVADQKQATQRSSLKQGFKEPPKQRKPTPKIENDFESFEAFDQFGVNDIGDEPPF